MKSMVAVHRRFAVESLEQRSLLSAAPSGLLHNVPQAANLKLVYDLDVPLLGGSYNAAPVPYSVHNSATAGKFDRVAVAKALHGLTVLAAKEPGVIMDVTVDANGDLDRESFIVEVKDGKQVVKETLPALGKKS